MNRNNNLKNNKKVVKESLKAKRQRLEAEAKRKEQFKKKSLIAIVIFSLIFFLLIVRIGYIQFVKGKEYSTMAYKQQTTSQIISPKRGNIYDATGKVLARSATVDTISVNPGQIYYSDGKEVPNDLLAEKFSSLFELNKDEILNKLENSSSVVVIAKKVEQEKVDTLKSWLSEQKITSGINIDADSKRYYPYDNLASNLIGFCGDENQGLSGIESYWNSTLTGTAGRIVTSTDVNKDAISDDNEQYIPAENGSDLYLTIDYYVQSISEKYLEDAVIENNADSGNVIIMEPSTGDILAMATYPDYNLNTPFTINDSGLQAKWDELSTEEKNTALQKMWRNKAVSDGYEPGSTFKLITSSIGLEENIVETDTENDFTCKGVYNVAGHDIHCWATNPHGSLTLRKALEKSCNPSFIQLGQRIGAKTFYKYLEAFGLLDRTGIETSGEATSYFHSLEDCKAVELATMSFGERFTVTPIQLVTAISAVVNDGVLMKPRIVSKTVNSDTGVVTNIEPEKVRQVISAETSKKVRNMMESVVTEGTGGSAAVKGFSIGGKSGTSEPPVSNPEAGYVASFVAISPVENTNVVALVILYNPKGHSHQGGTVAAPVASKILSDVLPYLSVAPTENSSEDNSLSTVTLPNVKGETFTQARKILEAKGFKVNLKSDSSNGSIIVTNQVPKEGTELLTNSIICLYSSESNMSVSTEVPNLIGMTSAQAMNSLNSKNLNIAIEGTGIVASQSIKEGESVEEGTVVKVTLK